MPRSAPAGTPRSIVQRPGCGRGKILAMPAGVNRMHNGGPIIVARIAARLRAQPRTGLAHRGGVVEAAG